MDIEGQTISKLQKEIKHPNHTHPFVLCYLDAFGDDCPICEVMIRDFHYGCRTCGFYICRNCFRKPFVIDPKRSHEHPLSLVPSFSLVFTCLACGVNRESYESSSFLCICIPCCFIIHKGCVSLPRVICINRHDHRISHVYPENRFYPHDWNCKVCRKNVDRRYGSYSCSTCSNYVVHSDCATNPNVWDGVELEGVPEEDPEEILPFKVVGEEGVIKYFSHDHNLRLIIIDKEKDDGNQIYLQCNACVGYIYSDPHYICTHDDCSFVLHEACANLPRKKRHPSQPHRLILFTKVEDFSSHLTFFECDCCGQTTSGFVYGEGNFCIDVSCASVLDGFVHGSHPHPLYFYGTNDKYCSVCQISKSYNMMNCEECEGFVLCFRCATLPYEVIKHTYDTHVLSLCYGEENHVGVVYWCEICEKRLDPSKWFYTCGECCSTLHIHCILGEDPYIRFGVYSDQLVGSFEVVHNYYITFQPNCYICPSRCQTINRHHDEDRNKSPFLCHGINVFTSQNLFFCSWICLKRNSGGY